MKMDNPAGGTMVVEGPREKTVPRLSEEERGGPGAILVLKKGTAIYQSLAGGGPP